ncbi:Ger(x)C family spore germination protein [Metallumcola ferriviriculae]|uniref:Ger(X)C family spore germination protein n=1 Tax=Metallumcola ferriviriculae TaxID=3039180 RepID=A0AAU0URP2_9FIRM|nr:Ger(x)C family spore germination protein [Desulfitibacteraceae bacterium MK1]
MLKRKLKIGILVLLTAALLFNGGCWSRQEIEELAIVTAAALDTTPNNDIQLSVLIIKPSALAGGQSGGGGGEENPTILVTATGKTISEATRNITKTLSRRIFWSHNRLILIGEDLAKSGVVMLDFLSRERQTRLTSWVMVTGGRAQDLLSVESELEKTISEQLAAMNRNRISLEVKLFTFLDMLAAKGVTPVVLPRIESFTDPMAQKGKQKKLRLNGAALFNEQSKLVGWMEESATRGLMWLRGEDVSSGVITFECPGHPGSFISMRVRDNSREVKVLVGEERLQIEVKLIGDVDLEEADCPTQLANSNFIKDVEKQVADKVTLRARRALKEAKDLQVDPFNFGMVVKNQLPDYWDDVKDKWSTQVFPEVPLKIVTEINLRRTGLTTNSLKKH